MTVAAHGGDIYQNQITYDFSVNTTAAAARDIAETDGGSGGSQQSLSTV